MEQAVIFKPFLATMVLTLVVWIYMYLRRLSFIFANDLDARKMTPGELARVSPPSVSTPSVGLLALTTSQASSNHTGHIYGMYLGSAATTASTSASSETGLAADVWLNYPFVLRQISS